MKCFVCGDVQQTCPSKNGVNVNITAAAVDEENLCLHSQASSELNTAAV